MDCDPVIDPSTATTQAPVSVTHSSVATQSAVQMRDGAAERQNRAVGRYRSELTTSGRGEVDLEAISYTNVYRRSREPGSLSADIEQAPWERESTKLS